MEDFLLGECHEQNYLYKMTPRLRMAKPFNVNQKWIMMVWSQMTNCLGVGEDWNLKLASIISVNEYNVSKGNFSKTKNKNHQINTHLRCLLKCSFLSLTVKIFIQSDYWSMSVRFESHWHRRCRREIQFKMQGLCSFSDFLNLSLKSKMKG